ncbi:sodium:proton antiporter [Janthinobacterium sp. ROICE36]|uniref:cation:proton antiporter n=1 Tax=Janthinobacterium sp. ROICE36 TaxID=2048670 RepID=UPI000C7F1F62|nr:sodium:proton antiporter [Janthinobacterium sp. ROICE36]PLY39787.1 sodium:proton antiporter [Janthinobacterium sp. ROICE36]
MLDVFAACLTLTALLAYLNHRFVGLPPTVGVMGIALLLSIALLILDAVGISTWHDYELSLLRSIDFSAILMQGMLSLLLFAGALHVDLRALRRYGWQVGLLAVVGTICSTVLIGGALYYLLPMTGVSLPMAWCMVFGALISPTDPISVMGILSSAKAPASLEIVIAGESLFNDGVGLALFVLAMSAIADATPPSATAAARLLLREAGGGIAFGLVLGYLSFALMSTIDSYQEEVLITLATVLGGYALANHLHVSGPLAMVVAGLIVGNHARAEAMSDTTRANVDMFWHLLDAILNAVLFMLVGLEIVVVERSPSLVLASATAVAVTLAARFLSVGLPLLVLGRRAGLPTGAWQVLTWGGLRGGISVALALSLPAGPEQDLVLALTYSMVVFSILGQGLTVVAVVRRFVLRHN